MIRADYRPRYRRKRTAVTTCPPKQPPKVELGVNAVFYRGAIYMLEEPSKKAN